MVNKSEIIWNTLGSFVESLLSAVLLMFCTEYIKLQIQKEYTNLEII